MTWIEGSSWRTRRQAAARLAIAGIVLLSVYESVGSVITAFGRPLRDGWVIAVERTFFPALPPLAPLPLASGVVDAFSVVYVAYFTLPVILLALLVWRGRLDEARSAMRTLLIAYYTHYAVYIVMPVVGPIRAPDVPQDVRLQLAAEGGALTRGVRHAIDAIECTPQDAFPSAHASIAVVVAALARRYRVRGQAVFAIAAPAIACSTIVLGYHYVVDLAAAMPLAWAALRAGVPRRGVALRHRVSPT